ncbi:helix-turn-helix transcriptional regulator [Nocardiopsis sp. YSL2]|uniref:helix-turn-helix transcriptional regulator n=1 Tax=Nocardiopsis sp. YSL2 TaxID=2939492 RepID=UPI0026F43CD0|nr:helix-turn-helix transcriptional regulator [Nocardiopsis sp. YSL2]
MDGVRIRCHTGGGRGRDQSSSGPRAHRHQLAQTRKCHGLTQWDIADALGVSAARVCRIEHGEVSSFEVVARFVEALGGRLELVAGFGDHTLRTPVSDPGTGTAA